MAQEGRTGPETPETSEDTGEVGVNTDPVVHGI